MSDVKISVIVPIYNIERYLEDCVDSILRQDFPETEIILVDDGSTDSGAAICEGYAARDERVIVCHKQNGGLSDARNFGLQRARGTYVLFADGDDMLLPGALATLYQKAEQYKAELVIGKARLSEPSESMERFERIAAKRLSETCVYSGREYLRKCLEGGALRVEVWRNLYRRSFLEENGLQFKVGTAHEDEEFTPRLLLAAERVVLCDSDFYYYRNDRADSIMNTASRKKITDRLAIYREQFSLYQSVRPRKLRRLLEDDLSWKYIDCLKQAQRNGFFDIPMRRAFPLRCAFRMKRRIKALLFAMHPRFFVKYF